jgi:hypothetical protein
MPPKKVDSKKQPAAVVNIQYLFDFFLGTSGSKLSNKRLQLRDLI